jgi:hypothetical protein
MKTNKKILFIPDCHYGKQSPKLKSMITKMLKSGSYIIMVDMFEPKKGKQ